MQQDFDWEDYINYPWRVSPNGKADMARGYGTARRVLGQGVGQSAQNGSRSE